MASDFLEAMDAAKTRAVQDRNRGRHTGKAAKGWNRARHHEPEGFVSVKRMLERWQSERDAAIHLYRLFAYEPDFDWSNWR